jgi:CMP-N,N'-diacetyllegionaminic acid synthase
MKHACLIPARGGSKGIPGKNIKDFCGKPLIVWSIEQAMASGVFGDEIYVSTDDSKIRREAEKTGAKIVDRPARISTDESPMIAVLQHANGIMDADYITLLQPTNPLRMSSDILGVITGVSQNKSMKNLIVCSVYEHSYYRFEDYSPIKGHCRQSNKQYCVSGLVYCFSADSLYCWPAVAKTQFHQIHRWQAHELDEPEDWKICEYLFREKILCSSQES